MGSSDYDNPDEYYEPPEPPVRRRRRQPSYCIKGASDDSDDECYEDPQQPLPEYPLEPYGTNMCHKHLTNLTIQIVYS